MSASPLSRPAKLLPGVRRRSMVCAYANGGLWGIGSGLASMTLVTYLAREYGATGLAIGWLLAAPAMVGLLRLLTPQWLELVGSRRNFCIGLFVASAVWLFALPIISAPQVLPNARDSIAALALLWIGYHLLEYFAVVALWSWFGDLVPSGIRGRFVGRRQAWMNAGKVAGTVIAAVGTYVWMNHCDASGQPELKWRAYAACSLAGAMMLAISVWPLTGMVDLPIHSVEQSPRGGLRKQLIGPWRDQKYRRLLVFGLWFSFSNGLVQTAQWMFMTGVLKLEFAEKKALDASSRGVQSMLMPSVGKWVDHRGNVRVLVISQTIIAMAPLFFLIATPETRWWILGAYFCWLAYAGENVTQPNLMLGLSPSGETPAYASAWFAWTQLAYSLSVLLGGALFDMLAARFKPLSIAAIRIDHFAVLFLASWLLKSIGVVWAARIRE